MGSIKVNLAVFHGSQGLHSRLQTIENQLDTVQSVKQVSRLTKELDQTCSALNQMKEKTQHVFGQSQLDPWGGLEEKIVEMYGRLEEALISRKISQIRSEADSIRTSLEQGSPVDTKTVNALNRHITLLLKNYRPKIQELQIINEARNATKGIYTPSAETPAAEGKVISHFDWLAHQKNVRMIEAIELEPGQYEDLFDIAAMVYSGKLREAASQFRQLPESLKRTVHQHLQELTAVIFEDEMETIQALLATANHLVNNWEPYPAQTQIDEIFLGLQEVLQTEESNSRVIALSITR